MHTVPLRIFDSHLHIVDPAFALRGNAGFIPAHFTVDDYRARTAGLAIVGGAVVAGSFQGPDSAYLEHALQQLGPGFVGVIQSSSALTEPEILRLHQAGVRAIRVNYCRDAEARGTDLLALGHRVHEIAGWHMELYMNAVDLPQLQTVLRQLPAVSIDHLGLTAAGLPALLHAVDCGVRVKATGFSRGDLDVAKALRAIHRANPQALMFGTDLPGTRAPRPFSQGDLDTLGAALGEAALDAVLCGNALDFYRVPAALRPCS